MSSFKKFLTEGFEPFSIEMKQGKAAVQVTLKQVDSNVVFNVVPLNNEKLNWSRQMYDAVLKAEKHLKRNSLPKGGSLIIKSANEPYYIHNEFKWAAKRFARELEMESKYVTDVTYTTWTLTPDGGGMSMIGVPLLKAVGWF